MSSTDSLPPELQALVDTVRNNHESMGGEQRGALAEIQARSILASERAIEVYEKAGKDSKKSSLGIERMTALLVIATLAVAVFTAFAK